jgi:hypothetical protein
MAIHGRHFSGQLQKIQTNFKLLIPSATLGTHLCSRSQAPAWERGFPAKLGFAAFCAELRSQKGI